MRIALNPIQWMASDDGWLDPSKAPERGKLLALIKEAGFDGVMTEVPAGWSIEQYQDAVGSLGLALAPGYAVCRSDGLDGTEAEVLDTITQIARQHATLGLTDIGLGMSMRKDTPREQHPAQGHHADDTRLTALTTLIGRITEIMLTEGVRPALHPHVATWIETETESRTILDALPELGFLPDTGHLAWAGTDIRTLITDYATRIPLVHVKDCRLSISHQGQTENWNYRHTVLAGIWTEPGRGELPLTDILNALPSTFNGWLMAEVDRPDITDPYKSAQASAQWMRANYR
jgi:inosose dehydratase